jgi:chromosome segregation ATPase
VLPERLDHAIQDSPVRVQTFCAWLREKRLSSIFHGNRLDLNQRPMQQFSTEQMESLVEQLNDLKAKLKKKSEQLGVTRQRLNNAKRTIKRLQTTLDYQRERILELHRGE